MQPVKLEDGQDPDFKPEKLAAGLQAAEEVPHLAAQLSQVLLKSSAESPSEDAACSCQFMHAANVHDKLGLA